MELKTPCSSSAVDGALRGAFIGLCWGLVIDTNSATVESGVIQKATARSSIGVASSVGRAALGFSAFLGIYNLVSCNFETIRGRKDPFNNFMGGAAAGALFGLSSKNPRTIAATAIGTGVMTSAVTMLQLGPER
mmetsp:Transcript_42902/g.97040  ORF Transcript_42902/g.97040 Transcript_42902/m.97040 type:complete len:134 (-) Transcript_42902:189-590(-)